MEVMVASLGRGFHRHPRPSVIQRTCRYRFPARTRTGTGLTVSHPFWPLPSIPKWLLPQHHASPASVVPHVTLFDALNARNRSSPCTGAGARWRVRVLSPGWPYSVFPQQYARPSTPSAHVWNVPVATAVKGMAEGTATGREREVRDPSPSCPSSLRPQQWTSPAAVTPHEWEYRASIVTKPCRVET